MKDVGKVRKRDLKLQGKLHEIGLPMERGISMGTTMKEEVDHHD